MDYEKIGLFIQNRRKELKMTQKELALKLNITDKAVSKWERGLGCPDVSLLGELSEALEVGIGEILNGEFNETLKDNSEFIKNAVDYSKNITEKNITENIKKILYMVLILITFYMSFMGIQQFIYLSGGISFRSYKSDITYKEYEKLTEYTKVIKEKGYLVYKDSASNYSFDYADSLEFLIKRIDYTKLLSNDTVEIKNTELINIEGLIADIHNIDIFCLNMLKNKDKNNSKYYDLAISSEPIFLSMYYVVDEKGNLQGTSMYDSETSMELYYSDLLYRYDEIKDNKKLLNQYYEQLSFKLTKLNKTLEFIIEVGESNENN